MEWQTIETAPKEKDILVYTKYGIKIGMDCADEGKKRKFLDQNNSFIGAATHWMQLPDPPQL